MANIIGLTFVIVCVLFGLTTALFVDDDPCKVNVNPGDEPTVTRHVTVPESCMNGTFTWNYPKRTVKLHFQNENRRFISVCIRNALLGNVLTVRDVTHTFGFPMVIGEKESCTFKYHETITLRIDAPETLYYVTSIYYRIIQY